MAEFAINTFRIKPILVLDLLDLTQKMAQATLLKLGNKLVLT